MNKGNGQSNTIMSLLTEISFGENYFEMAILFRNSMLINSLLSSSEVLYNIELKHIKFLERCDKNLVLRILSAPSTCSYESVYLETGCLPIRFILQGRRLMYLWALLNKNEDELVQKVFTTQKDFSSKDDWILQVEDDKSTLGIDISDDSIMKMKKETFKKLVKKKLNHKAKEFLFNYKNQENQSKSKNLNSFSLQNYFKSTKLSTKEKKLLFSLRTRTVDVKTNYRNKYKFNMQCRLCDDKTTEESEKHLLKCVNILKNINPNTHTDLSRVTYEDIFSEDIEVQIAITKIFSAIFKTRQKLLVNN